jgi:uncharacterized protein DUF6781
LISNNLPGLGSQGWNLLTGGRLRFNFNDQFEIDLSHVHSLFLEKVMTESKEQEQEQTAARESVERGSDIENEVRNIVVEALSDGKIDSKHIKEVVSAVVEGALKGASATEKDAKDALQKTIKGVDEALSQVAQASKLAIEEAAGKAEEYTDHDLKRAMDDLKELEELFFETVGDVAKQGRETSYNILNDLLSHAQQSSTSVGSTIKEASENLQNLFIKSGKNLQVADAARATGASMARITSGFLAGIADSLSPKEKK